MNFQESPPICPFPCNFSPSLQSLQNLQDLLNLLKFIPNSTKFELKYIQNRALFKESLDLPQTLPALAEIEWFWLKMIEKPLKVPAKNLSIVKESGFFVWLISVFEELLWEKPFFKLVTLSK